VNEIMPLDRPAILANADGAFERLSALVAADMAAVNETILTRLKSREPMIPAVARHIIESGGKRLRPMLLLAAARLCGYDGADHVKLAAVLEFIHNATLLHDDVVDKSTLRRGRKTANVLWGDAAPILVGDFLYSRSFELMVETGSLPVIGALAKTSNVIAEGEVMQLAAQKRLETGEDEYLAIITAKTAEFFATAAKIGAMVAGATDGDVASLETHGRELGIAFQLIDDALDYGGLTSAIGKNTGDDFAEGKVTLPVIYAFARGAADERAFWARTMADGDQTPDDLATALELLIVRDGLADTILRAHERVASAKAAIAHFPEGAYRQALVDLADFCVARAH